jgi:hypothetical protein
MEVDCFVDAGYTIGLYDNRDLWYNVVGIATRLRSEWSGVQISGKSKIFLNV